MPETMAVSGESLPRKLSLNLKTPFFGLKLHVVLLVLVGIILCVAAILALAFLCVYSKRRAKETRNEAQSEEKRVSGSFALMGNEVETGASSKGMVRLESANVDKLGEKGTAVDGGRAGSGGQKSGGGDDAPGRSSSAMTVEEQRRMGWGRWYRLRELEIATCGFAEESVIGEGGYGIVHRGVLDDDSVVAIKRLHNKKGQAELEFKVEVEAIGKVRHKNLVALVGYCVEDSQRILVYEYVDNGNLAQWLHGDVGPISPLTWGIRMKIAVGMAKGLAYLHEGLEPKVVHRDVKASNILLDKKWNPKISDFGLAKLLGSEASHVTTRVMGTFGYVSPEYASTGMLNEWSDVYSFGILLMEIVSGRTPIDYSRPAAEMNLVDWFKGMVASHRGEEIVDPLIAIPPPPRVLKRVLLVCLRCINLDAKQRPKMGHIVHMLETDDFPFRAGFTSEV